MKKKTNLTLCLATCAVCLASAFGLTGLDSFQLKNWDERNVTNTARTKEIERVAERARSQARFTNNIHSPQGMKRTASIDANIDPKLVIDDGTRINFNIINWYMGDFMGMGSVRPVYNTPIYDENSINENTRFEISQIGNGIYADGSFYAVNYTSGGGAVMSASFVEYDAETLELKRTITLPEQWYSVWDAGAYDIANDKLIVIGYDLFGTKYLSEVNTETGVYSYIVQCADDYRVLAFDKQGTLYGINYDGYFVQIDQSTGECTQLFRVLNENTKLYYWNTLAFDYHTNELFWIHTNEYFETDLRRINISEKSVDIVSPLPMFGAISAWVESPKADNNAPNTVANLSTSFTHDDLKTGSIIFTAPNTTFGGEPLTGSITAVVTVDDNKVGEITTEAGKTESIDNIDFLFNGEHKVAVTFTNTYGSGPEGSITAYCGPDEPRPVNDVIFSVDDKGVSTLQWKAPESGIHNGVFIKERLTYDVVRYPECIRVAEGIKTTEFSETLPSALDRYWYGVTVSCDGIAGAEALSNSIVCGEPMTIPFDREIGGEEFFNLFTIYDLDGDENTWYETWGSTSCATAYHEAGFVTDDWMIMPPIYFEPGNYYIETEAAGIGGIANADLTFGNSQQPESHATILKMENLIYEDGIQTFTTRVTVEKAGKYYIGYHFISTTDGTYNTPYMSVYTLKVEKGPAATSPSAVSNLRVEAYPKGELKATVYFTAPTTDFAGSTLSSIDKVEICNSENKVLGTVEDVVPGENCTYELEVAQSGESEYRVYAYNESGRGDIASITAYVGVDIPGLITSLKYTVTDNRIVTFEWGKPTETGIRGGYVNPDNLVYDFCRSEYDYVEPFPMDNGRDISGNRFEVEECTDESYFGTQQHTYYYGVKAKNEMGEGPLGYIGIVLGNPVSIPFRESFNYGYFNSEVWSYSLMSGYHSWGTYSTWPELGIEPIDNDGGMLVFAPQNDTITSEGLIMPLTALKNMKNPVLIFDMYHTESGTSDDILNIQAQSGSMPYKMIADIAVKAETAGWQEHKVSLSEFNNSDRLFIALVGVAGGSTGTFAIDNVRIMDDLAYDLAIVDFTTPEQIYLNEKGNFVVKVESHGTESIEKFAIDLYANDILIATQECSSILPLETREVTMQASAMAYHADTTINIEARINLESDLNENNNTASATLYVIGSSFPSPRNVKGSKQNNNMTLTWDDPEEYVISEKVESFEEYESFAITSRTEWCWVDGDQLVPYGISGVTYPNMDQPRAFMIWHPEKIDDLTEKSIWAPFSGSKCLIAFAASYFTIDGELEFSQQNDEWLISPHVIGNSTVKFMYNKVLSNYTEYFEIYVSKKTRDIADFELLGNRETVTEAGWKEYSFILPEDAQYFAIRYVSNGYEGFVLLIDDITYTPGYSNLEMQGFHIYHNGTRVTDTPINTNTHTLPFISGQINEYGVSAVYNYGESVATQYIDDASIEDTVADNDVVVSTRDRGIVIKCAENSQIRIFDIAGRAVSSFKSCGDDFVSLGYGVYIVCVDNVVVKVII